MAGLNAAEKEAREIGADHADPELVTTRDAISLSSATRLITFEPRRPPAIGWLVRCCAPGTSCSGAAGRSLVQRGWLRPESKSLTGHARLMNSSLPYPVEDGLPNLGKPQHVGPTVNVGRIDVATTGLEDTRDVTQVFVRAARAEELHLLQNGVLRR